MRARGLGRRRRALGDGAPMGRPAGVSKAVEKGARGADRGRPVTNGPARIGLASSWAPATRREPVTDPAREKGVRGADAGPGRGARTRPRGCPGGQRPVSPPEARPVKPAGNPRRPRHPERTRDRTVGRGPIPTPKPTAPEAVVADGAGGASGPAPYGAVPAGPPGPVPVRRTPRGTEADPDRGAAPDARAVRGRVRRPGGDAEPDAPAPGSRGAAGRPRGVLSRDRGSREEMKQYHSCVEPAPNGHRCPTSQHNASMCDVRSRVLPSGASHPSGRIGVTLRTGGFMDGQLRAIWPGSSRFEKVAIWLWMRR